MLQLWLPALRLEIGERDDLLVPRVWNALPEAPVQRDLRERIRRRLDDPVQAQPLFP